MVKKFVVFRDYNEEDNCVLENSLELVDFDGKKDIEDFEVSFRYKENGFSLTKLLDNGFELKQVIEIFRKEDKQNQTIYIGHKYIFSKMAFISDLGE